MLFRSRMSFEITGISYDSARKQNSLLKTNQTSNSTNASTAYMGVPYDITFELNVYARNIDDGTHIVEQIMPFFNPDFTVSAQMVPDLGFYKDIPIIMNSITNNIQYEGNYDSVRYVNWTLTFTMKMHYYGPVSSTKIIRNVLVNIFNDIGLRPGYITKMTVANANGTFKQQDQVFQGSDYKSANAYGIILNYRPEDGLLTLGATQGSFHVNNHIHAVSTNANAIISSFDVTPLKLVNIDIKPDPITAQPGDDYGYDINITEWPDTEA